MNLKLVELWNETVGPEDTVYYLGDFALQSKLVPEWLPRLSGKKHLISGNHDACHSGDPKWVQYYLDAGFETVRNKLIMDIAGELCLLHHFPYRSDPAQKYWGSRPVDCGLWLLHGHTHQPEKQNGKMICVCVEAWDYKPVSVEEIAKLIAAGPAPRLTREISY